MMCTTLVWMLRAKGQKCITSLIILALIASRFFANRFVHRSSQFVSSQSSRSSQSLRIDSSQSSLSLRFDLHCNTHSLQHCCAYLRANQLFLVFASLLLISLISCFECAYAALLSTDLNLEYLFRQTSFRERGSVPVSTCMGDQNIFRVKDCM